MPPSECRAPTMRLTIPSPRGLNPSSTTLPPHTSTCRIPSLHRLNRAEYSNAVRDLAAIEVDAQAVLPPDEQAYGFENNADALSMQPALLDRYVNAASAIARRAIGDPNMPPAVVRYGAIKNNPNDLTYLRQTDRLSEEFPLGSKGGVAARHYFPVDGQYSFRVKLQRAWDNVIRGLNTPNDFEIRIDGARVWQMKLGGEKTQSRPKTFEYDGDDVLQGRGVRQSRAPSSVATMLKADGAEAEGGGPDRYSSYSRASDNGNSPIAIAALLIGGPYEGKLDLESASRKLIYVCTPATAPKNPPMPRRSYRGSHSEPTVAGPLMRT